MSSRFAHGYYWVQSKDSGEWTVAMLDSVGWQFGGALWCLDDDEMTNGSEGEYRGYVIGPRIEEPKP